MGTEYEHEVTPYFISARGAPPAPYLGIGIGASFPLSRPFLLPLRLPGFCCLWSQLLPLPGSLRSELLGLADAFSGRFCSCRCVEAAMISGWMIGGVLENARRRVRRGRSHRRGLLSNTACIRPPAVSTSPERTSFCSFLQVSFCWSRLVSARRRRWRRRRQSWRARSLMWFSALLTCSGGPNLDKSLSKSCLLRTRKRQCL